MTVLTATQIVGNFQIAPLAPVASSSGPSAAGLGGRIDTTWARKSDLEQGNRKARRAALAAAKAKVEAGATKAERLARQQSGGRVEIRQTGSETERRDTRGSVAKAAASLSDVPMESDFSGEDFRTVRNTLRALYPGRRLSEMLEQAAKLERMLMDDPAAAYETLVASYSRSEPAPYSVVDPVSGKGLRASLQRARQDQEDMADLREWVAKYGKRIPQILTDLAFHDISLRQNPSLAAAKLAVKFGAPAVQAEVPAYEAKMAAKQAQKARHEHLMALVDLAIQGGMLPSDEASLAEVARIMANPKFQHNRSDEFDTLKRAGAIVRHPDHKWMGPRPSGKAAGKRDSGSLSISGANTGQYDGSSHDRDRGKRSARAAVQEAVEPGSSRRYERRGEAGTGSIRASIARVRAAL